MPKNFKIYSSSAGSGKTFTLTKEYIKLALKYDKPFYFKNILAITFTNDAANEMKERIIDALKNFSRLDELTGKTLSKTTQLLDMIVEETGISSKVLQERANKVFSKIIYNYADFSVSTIDSFVNKLISAFTRELEIPYNYEVDLETEKLLGNTIDRVLEKVGRDEKQNLSELVISWVNQKAEEGKNWIKIAEDLVSFAFNLVNETTYRNLALLENLKIHDFKIIKESFDNLLNAINSKVSAYAQTALEAINQAGVSGQLSGGKSKSMEKYFENHKEGFYLSYKVPKYLSNALQNNVWYSKSKSLDIKASIDSISLTLFDCASAIEDLREKYFQQYSLISIILPHFYKLALSKEIQDELIILKKENNAIHISDTHRKIAKIIAHEPIPYIFERVGERYDHLLIDEFQDTSVLQWQNLLPLVENNLSEGKFNLIVGDAKQAIYRWRGGEMEQLVFLYKNKFEELLKINPENSTFLADRYHTLAQNHLPAQLNANYRSKKEVIEFNNEFFQVLVNKFGQSTSLLSEIYDQHFAQKVPNPDNNGGHVALYLVSKNDGYRENMLKKVLDVIHEAEGKGFKRHEIAIITRNNHEGKEIASFLKEQQPPILVISQTSLLLNSDEHLRFLIAIFKVINKPEDKLAKSESLYLFYKAVLGKIPNDQDNLAIEEIIHKGFFDFYDVFIDMGYDFKPSGLHTLNVYELAEQVIGIFHLFDNHPKSQYLFRFLDVILEFNKQKATTLGDFLKFWEEQKHKLSINTPKIKDAIIITTIHKSKGLEYPVVITPFLSWSYAPKKDSTMWVRLDDKVFDVSENNPIKKLKTAIVTMKQDLDKTCVKDQYDHEKEKLFIENINLLYVAFTRASESLYLLTQEGSFKDSKKDTKGVNFLVYQYLFANGFWEEGKHEYILKKGANTRSEKEESEENIFEIETFITTDVHKKFKKKGAVRKKDV